MSTYINKELNSRYQFRAPHIEGDTDGEIEVPFPTSGAKEVTLASNAAAVTVERAVEIVKLGTLAAASTLTLAPGSDLKPGDRLVVTWTEPSTAVGCTFKHGETTLAAATATKGSNSAKVARELLYDGETWIVM